MNFGLCPITWSAPVHRTPTGHSWPGSWPICHRLGLRRSARQVGFKIRMPNQPSEGSLGTQPDPIKPTPKPAPTWANQEGNPFDPAHCHPRMDWIGLSRTLKVRSWKLYWHRRLVMFWCIIFTSNFVPLGHVRFHTQITENFVEVWKSPIWGVGFESVKWSKVRICTRWRSPTLLGSEHGVKDFSCGIRGRLVIKHALIIVW